MKLTLPKDTLVPTTDPSLLTCTERTKERTIGLTRARGVHPDSVIAVRDFRGTVLIRTTVSKDAGYLLRVPTVTRRFKVRVAKSAFSHLREGTECLLSIHPTKE